MLLWPPCAGSLLLSGRTPQVYARCRRSAFSVLAGGSRPRLVEGLHVVEVESKYGVDLLLLEAQILRGCGVEHEEDLVQLPVAAAGYLLLDPAGSEGDEPLGRYPQAELLLDLSQAVQRLLACREVPCCGNVEVVRPGVFRGGAPLEEQVGSSWVGTADPTVKTTVPQPQPVRLAFRNDLPRQPPRLIQDIQQLVHTNKSSISTCQQVSRDLHTRRLKC